MSTNGQPGNLPAPRDPWDRQPGETAKAFQAFSIYRDLDPSTRSIRRAAEILGKGEPTLNPWSQKWHWPERAAAYDAYRDRAEREIRETQRQEMLRRHLALGASLQVPVFVFLRGDEAKGIEPIVDPKKLTAMEAARLAEVGARIEREASGMDGTGKRGSAISPAESRAIVQNMMDMAFDVIAQSAADPDAGERWAAEYFRRVDEYLNGGGWRSAAGE